MLLYEQREDCRVIVDGEEKVIATRAICSELTARSTDATAMFFAAWTGSENIPFLLKTASVRQSGVAVFDDAQSLSLGAEGKVLPERGEGSDEYIFAYGKDYRAAVRALYLITGNVPMIPRYALGNWWSRYHVYTDKEYLRVMSGFERRGVPFTVATIDMDWHYSDTKEIDEKYHITENNLTAKNTSAILPRAGITVGRDIVGTSGCFPITKSFCGN